MKGVSDTNHGILGKLELCLKRNEKENGASTDGIVFCVGKSTTAPDFHLYEMLLQYSFLAKYVKAADPLVRMYVHTVHVLVMY